MYEMHWLAVHLLYNVRCVMSNKEKVHQGGGKLKKCLILLLN